MHNPWQQQPAECRLQQITGCDKSAYSEAATRPLQQISHCRERKRRILTGTDRHNHAHTEMTPWANKNWAAYHSHYHQMGDSTWWSAQGWAYRHATFAQSSKLKTQNIAVGSPMLGLSCCHHAGDHQAHAAAKRSTTLRTDWHVYAHLHVYRPVSIQSPNSAKTIAANQWRMTAETIDPTHSSVSRKDQQLRAKFNRLRANRL